MYHWKTLCMKCRRIAFYPYEDVKGKTLNQYVHNVEKVLAGNGKLFPFYHTKETVNNIFRYDTIFLNWFENELTWADCICLVLARMLGKKVVWTFHNRVAHDSKDSLKDKKKIRFMMWVSSKIIVLSKNSIPYIYEIMGKTRRIRKKIVYVPHINYCDNYRPRMKSSLSDRGGAEEFVFLYFGQIRPYKNLEILIEAFQKLDIKNSKLIIAGKSISAEYTKKIKALCADNAQIELDLRFIADAEVYDYMSHADVVVLPYDKKSSMNSGAMIAAFSCKKPVIVPDIAMARDYRKCDYVYMYCYQEEEQHVAQLQKMMKRAYMQGKEKNRIAGEQAYADVLKENGTENVTKCLSVLR